MARVAFFTGLKRPAFVVNQSEIINENDSNNMTSNYRWDESKREERGNHKEETGSNKESERKEENNREEASESKREGENEEKPKTYRDPDILQELYDNETPYEELITKKYPSEDMERIKRIMNGHKDFSMLELFPYVDIDYPFECVRSADRVNYVMFQGEDESLLCVFFNKSTLKICQVEQFYKFYSVEDFEGKLQSRVTKKEDIEAVFGKLEKHLSYETVADRIVKEGTLFFIFKIKPHGLIFYEVYLFRDGETFPDGYDYMPVFGVDGPELLPMDKHIGKEDGKKSAEKSNLV